MKSSSYDVNLPGGSVEEDIARSAWLSGVARGGPGTAYSVARFLLQHPKAAGLRPDVFLYGRTSSLRVQQKDGS